MTAIMEIGSLSLFCFIQAAGPGVLDLFLPSRFLAIQDDGHLHASEGVLLSLSSKMSANILDRGLLKVANICRADPVSPLLAFERASESA